MAAFLSYTSYMAVLRNSPAAILVLCLFILFSAGNGAAQSADAVHLAYVGGGAYKSVEISDWSRYDNGTYVGHVYRELRANLSPVFDSAYPRGNAYSGHFFLMERTLRDMSLAAKALDQTLPATFVINADGSIIMKEDKGQPALRGFPAFPEEAVKPGDSWTARFSRVVDPFTIGENVTIPAIAEFRFQGQESYKGVSVYRINAKYATRYRAAADGTELAEASGTHEVDILISVDSGQTVLMRDRLDETFRQANGNSVRYKGFTLVFSDAWSPVRRSAVAAALLAAATPQDEPGEPGKPGSPDGLSGGPTTSPESLKDQLPGDIAASNLVDPSDDKAIEDSAQTPIKEPFDSPLAGVSLSAGPDSAQVSPEFELALLERDGHPLGISLEESEIGVKLVLRDLRFVADSDEILPEERDRLDVIANTLRPLSQRSFLVEGHSASVGKPAGELELSERRAKRVVDEFVSRGIKAEAFVYKGWGGTKPAASNDSEEGRAKNRRVEITILD